MKKKVLVIGMGKSGKGAALFLLSKGYAVKGVDKRHDSLEMQSWVNSLNKVDLTLGDDSELFDLSPFEFIVISPGIPPSHPLYEKALAEKKELYGEADLAFKEIEAQEKKPCLIGITGSNGKTTLTLFLKHLFQLLKMDAEAIGNVGYPFTEFLLSGKKPEVNVCELSSYQLETLNLQVFDIGVLLAITPNHLDRYASFEEYAEAKINLLRCIKPSGLLIVEEGVFHMFKDKIIDAKIPYICFSEKKFSDPLTKEIQERNMGLEVMFVARCILQKLHLDETILAEAIHTFIKPSHRLERIDTVDGVDFINDSKATTVEAVIYAVDKMRKDVVLIVGGKDKGLPFHEWSHTFGSKVKRVLAIGESAKRIKDSLQEAFDVEICKDLSDATEKAFFYAENKCCVLLSPGCSSFDSYRDYEQRGEHFKQIVIGLKQRV